MRAREGTDIAIRDFTGLDCNGWVYDLFRPDEPYAARGVHPSGTGINRYRSFSELAPAEQAYLRQQSRLSVLSLVDPQLLGFRRFTVAWGEGPPLAFNAALRYLPAAFGWNLRADLFAQRGPLGLVLALHGYFNQVRVLPGIDAALVGFPFAAVGAAVLSLDLRLALWLQPSGLRFATEASTPGALGALRLTARRGPAAAFAEVEAKSAGWVAGNVYLDANVSARVGAAVHFLR
jgi:hypothetical protein